MPREKNKARRRKITCETFSREVSHGAWEAQEEVNDICIKSGEGEESVSKQREPEQKDLPGTKRRAKDA